MRIDYHDLYSSQFEDLAVAICKVILGPSTQTFTKGKDGGRDGRFNGTADLFPSSANPHSGKFIIQAKHTFNPIAKMADTDFQGANGIIEIEKTNIQDLISDREVDHYLLFTNRRDSANKIVEFEKDLENLGLKSATIYGIENIDMWIKMYPNILTIADIEYMDAPLRVIPDELAEIILELKDIIKDIDGSQITDQEIKRTSFEKKCQMNSMTDEYKSMILRKYLKEFDKIDEFLAMPANDEIQNLYIETADEFDAEIIERIGEVKIESLLNDLIKRLIYRDIDLKRNSRLTRSVIYYMYWNCDIGIEA